MRTKLIVLVALLVCSVACQKTIQPANPQQAVSIEQQVYASLMTAQTALEGLRAQSATLPAIKTQLNQAIASYNVAEKAFTDFEAAKSANLSDPTTIVQVQAMILDLETQITQLGKSFGATPAPVQEAK